MTYFPGIPKAAQTNLTVPAGNKAPLNLPLTQDKNAFGNILESALAAARASSSASATTGPLLNKEDILLLAENMRHQMNMQLLRLIVGDDRDLPSPISLMKIPQIALHEALTYPQAGQKTAGNPTRAELDVIIQQVAREEHIDADFIRAVIKAESNFDNNAVSVKGAMGLMQLMPETARELGVKDPFDPYENIRGGTRYLKMLLSRYEGDVTLALAAYNWGMGNLERSSGRGLPAETRNYINRIETFLKQAKI